MVYIRYDKENPAESSQKLETLTVRGDFELSVEGGFDPKKIGFFKKVGNQLRTKNLRTFE